MDDGSSDGTGDEARAHGAAVVMRHEHRGGVGAAIRDGWKAGWSAGRPIWPCSRATTSTSRRELVAALETLLDERRRLRPGFALDARRPRRGPTADRAHGHALYSLVFSMLVFRRVTDATNGFRVFRRRSWTTRDQPGPGLARPATTSSRTSSTRPSGGAIGWSRCPCTVRYHAREGFTKMRGCATGGACSGPPSCFAGGEAMTSNPAAPSAAAACSSPAGPASSGGPGAPLVSGRPGHRPGRPVHGPRARTLPTSVRVRARARSTDASAGPASSWSEPRSSSTSPRATSSPRREPAGGLRDEHRRHAQRAAGRPRRRGRRVVYTSSASVYGNPRVDPDQRGRRPLAALALRRQQARRRELLLAFYESYGLPVAVSLLERLRAGPAAGRTRTAAWSPSSSWRVRRQAARQSTATASRPATSPTSTTPSRRPCWRRPSRGPRARSSTSGPGRDPRQRAGGVRSAEAGAEVVGRHIDRRDMDNIRRRVVNIEKTRRMLRWSPQVTLPVGLSRTARWIEQGSFDGGSV